MHTKALIEYLKGLSENNNRAWFVMAKPSYDILRAEFTELVARVIAQTAKFDPAIALNDPKKAQFRINRDVRFSKDKSLYKTHFSAVLGPAGKKDPESHYYFQINEKGNLMVAAGCHMPPPDVLAKIRHFIAAEPKIFAKLLKNKTWAEYYTGFGEVETLKRPPKGFDVDTPHIEFIKQKSFIAGRELNAQNMSGDEIEAEIVKGFKAALPLMLWLREAAKKQSLSTIKNGKD